MFNDKYTDENPDLYYDRRNSIVNRLRTYSLTEESNSRSNFHQPDAIVERSHENSPTISTEGTPAPEIPPHNVPQKIRAQLQVPGTMGKGPAPRRPSIVPFYDSGFEAHSTSDVVNIDEDLYRVDQATKRPDEIETKANKLHLRRSSYDESSFSNPRKFYIADIDATLEQLLENEDTDHNHQITIEDAGPKVLKVGTMNSNGFKQFDVRGTYMLSNLLQELTIARRLGKTQMVLDENRLNENPVFRMKRLISTQFWKRLTRRLTKDTIVEMSKDTKITDDYIDEHGKKVVKQETHRIYIPHNRKDQYEYFMSIKRGNPDVDLDIKYLPEIIDARFIRSINNRPGLLALQSWPDKNDPTNLINEPYVVPGGRFNELYGWDSYMESLGLLVDATAENPTNLELSKGMAENFVYEINHYGKILNANRSYYLGRSQPPFLTDMAIRIFNKMIEIDPNNEKEALKFLERAALAAVKEYDTVWCRKPRLDEETGLSCYHPEGIGIPPETESSHFVEVLKPYCEKYNVDHDKFVELYNSEVVSEPELDEYFLHDRAVRESGHDTSYRLEGVAAHLATVDLNSLLYKYETDLSFIIKTYFNDKLLRHDGKVESSAIWDKRAKTRKLNITKYLWNEEDSMFYDYNIKSKKQTGYESATTFWPLYAKAATEDQAAKLVKNSLPKLEEFGGLAAGTEKSRGQVNLNRPTRQWDYPYGWAPQQILAWIGLDNYGFHGLARRLVYRWCYLMTKAFADYNGVVVEKYNVVEGATPHKVDAEYGNQGADFKGVATEGFGWVNASYIFGLTFLNLHAIRNLGTLTPPQVFLKNMHESQRELYQ